MAESTQPLPNPHRSMEEMQQEMRRLTEVLTQINTLQVILKNADKNDVETRRRVYTEMLRLAQENDLMDIVAKLRPPAGEKAQNA